MQHEKVEVIKSCAVSIGRIAEADDQYVKEIQKNDGIKLLTHVIDLNNYEVMDEGLNALNLIAKSDPKCIEQIHQLGIVEKVLNAMNDFGKHLEVSQAAIEFLQTLSTSQDCLAEISENSGVKTILANMKLHPDSKKVWQNGLKTISMIADSTQ
jgi:hypothetical protein